MINISKKYLGIHLKDCKLLGQGCEGKVYITPKGTALKVFKNKRKCKQECYLLKKVQGSKFFPKLLETKNNIMLREFVGGISLNHYLANNKLSEKVSVNLICLIEEFERLGFKRLDMAGRHIFIQENEEIMVIDPRKCYAKKVSIPFTLLRNLEQAGALEDFIAVLIRVRPKLAEKWVKAINEYL